MFYSTQRYSKQKKKKFLAEFYPDSINKMTLIILVIMRNMSPFMAGEAAL
jgi:hypothetical protein